MNTYVAVGLYSTSSRRTMFEAVNVAELQGKEHVCILKIKSSFGNLTSIDLVTTVMPIKTVAPNVEVQSIENNLKP